MGDIFLAHCGPITKLRENEFTVLQWPPQSPDHNPIEHLWDVVEWKICIMEMQLINVQQHCDVIMSIWTKISNESF